MKYVVPTAEEKAAMSIEESQAFLDSWIETCRDMAKECQALEPGKARILHFMIGLFQANAIPDSELVAIGRTLAEKGLAAIENVRELLAGDPTS